MDVLKHLIDLFLHLDVHLEAVLRTYGTWTYLLLFAIVFCETGLVVTPILPGDSLLFAAGAFAAKDLLSLGWVMLVLFGAAVLGDTANYWIGHFLGPRLLTMRRIVRPEHLQRTHDFYERYGGKTIIIARFVPIVRTFAPFVAGLGRMSYWRFMSYNVVGGALWVAVCTLAGYRFGQFEIVQKNFSLVVLAIIGVSLLPAVFEFWRERRRARRQAAAGPAD
jgi:membrane-associated protein